MKPFNIKDFITNEETPLCFADGVPVCLEHYYDDAAANDYNIVVSYIDDDEKLIDLMRTNGMCKIINEQVYFKPSGTRGWINIIQCGAIKYTSYIYPTKEDALRAQILPEEKLIDTIQIEWHE